MVSNHVVKIQAFTMGVLTKKECSDRTKGGNGQEPSCIGVFEDQILDDRYKNGHIGNAGRLFISGGVTRGETKLTRAEGR